MELGPSRPNRITSQQPQTTAPQASSPSPSANGVGSRMPGKPGDMPKLFRVGFVALLFAATALIVTLALSFSISSGRSKATPESQYVNKDRYQAVFLNGGQVYFGKIDDYSSQYIRISDIYYLRVQQQVQPGSQEPKQDISLAKLGSELHGPEDSMVINRDMVIFWENLKDDGQVVKAIVEYKKNPEAANQQTQAPTTPTTPPATPPATTTPPPTTPPATNRRP